MGYMEKFSSTNRVSQHVLLVFERSEILIFLYFISLYYFILLRGEISELYLDDSAMTLDMKTYGLTLFSRS